jgi:acetyl-CoA C-acetyltransferase
VRAIDAGIFTDEIVPLLVPDPEGTRQFAVDEHSRRGISAEKVASLNPLYPEIEGFSISAGNASGVNDGAGALELVSDELVREQSLRPMATVRAAAAAAAEPHRTGYGALAVIPNVLRRTGYKVGDDVDVWEINDAFASVPLAACRALGIDEERVNLYGSVCTPRSPGGRHGSADANHPRP